MKCPNCGSSKLYATNTLDSEYWHGAYHDTVNGVCPDCGKSWRWVEVFTFNRYEHPVEEEEEEVNDHH